MFELTSPTDALLKTFTPRTEKHGDEEVSAASLGLKLTGANTMLDTVQPGLRGMIYKAVEGQDQLPGVEPATPLLRSKGVESIKLAACFEGWTLRIYAGFDESEPFVISGAKVDRFVVTPKEGGSIELDFRVGSSDIDETEAGWLYGHQKQDISFSLHAPEKPGEAIDGTQAAFEADHPDAGSLFAAEHGQGGPDEDPDGEGDRPDHDAELEAEPKAKGRRSRRAAEVE